MTIPILPGPFSFLTGAGEALGAFGKGRSERNIYEQQQAQKNVEILTSLIQRGLVDPQVLAAHGTAAMLHSAGLPGLEPSQIDTPQATTEARRYNAELGALPVGSPASQQTVKVTTPQDVQIKKGAAAQARTAEVANTGLTVPQAQAKEGIVSAETAPLIQQAQSAGAREQIEKSKGLDQIWQNVQKYLPANEQFRNVANYAAVGGLGFLTSLNDMYARLGAERTSEHTAQVRLLTTVHSNASREYQQATAIWAKSLQDEIDRQTNIIGPAGRMTEEEKNALRNNIVQQYEAKRPKMETFLKDAIDAYGADQGEYAAAVRGVAGGISNQGAVGKAGPKGDPYATMKSARSSGDPQLSDENIDASKRLTPEQKAELKKIPYGKKPGGGASF